jgi:large subunit ribosomal protein L22
MIRGKRVGEALAILRFTNKRAADAIEKCLRSAIANATEAAERTNVAVDPDELVVRACFVDMGPHKNRRRVRPAPQGRAYREQRHFCHVTVMVASEDGAAKTPQGRSKKAAAVKGDDRKAEAAGRKRGAAKAAAPPSTAEPKTAKKSASKQAEAAPAEETAE